MYKFVTLNKQYSYLYEKINVFKSYVQLNTTYKYVIAVIDLVVMKKNLLGSHTKNIQK